MEHIDNNIYKQVNNNIYRQDPQAEAEEIRETAAGHEENSPPPPSAMEMDSALKDAAYWSGKLEMLNKADEENQRQYAETYDPDEDEDDDEEEYDDDGEDDEDELLHLAREYAAAQYRASAVQREADKYDGSQNAKREFGLAQTLMNSIGALAQIECEKRGIEIKEFYALMHREIINLASDNHRTTQKNNSHNHTGWPDVGKIVNDALRGAEKGAREAGKAAREAARNAAKNARGAVRGMNFHGMNFNNGWSNTGGGIGTGKLSVLLKPVRDMIEAVSDIGDETIRLQQLNELMGFLREIFNDINQGPDDVIGTGKLSVLLEPVREMIEAVGEIGDETIRAQHLTELRGFLRGIYNDIKQSSD
jgi:hypothetical protein